MPRRLVVMKSSIVLLLLTIGSVHLQDQKCQVTDIKNETAMSLQAEQCLHLRVLPNEIGCAAKCFLEESFQIKFDSSLTIQEQFKASIKGCTFEDGTLVKEFAKCMLRRAPRIQLDVDDCHSFVRLVNCTMGIGHAHMKGN